jgi:hypothetical protein
MSLEHESTQDLSERYVKQLEVYSDLIKVLEASIESINRVENEVTIIEEELIKRGVEIKPVAEN